VYLKKTRTNSRVYLSFVQGYRSNGKVKSKTIEKIGYLDDLEKLYDDPIAHFTAIAKERNLADTPERSIEVSLNKHLEDNTSTRKNLGYAIIKRSYSLLEINKFLQNKQKHLNIEYNLNSIFSLFTYNSHSGGL
jgi:hypothetical protein